MTAEQATYRYFKMFTPAMLIYVVGSAGTTWASGNTSLPAFALYGLALVPIVAILVAFLAHWRLIVELDEFLRLIQIKAVLFGVAGAMTVAAGWGTLEMLVHAPALQVFWLLPIFWVVFSAAAVVISKREDAF